MTLYVIGLTGPKGVGKTTIAKKLVAAAARRGVPSVRIAFADALRGALVGAGVRPGVLNGDKDDAFRKGHGATGRDLLIAFGQHMRARDPDHWVKAWRGSVEDAYARAGYGKHLLVIADDVRFDNEAIAVRRGLVGRVLHVERPGVVYAGGATETPIKARRGDLECDVSSVVACRAILDAVLGKAI